MSLQLELYINSIICINKIILIYVLNMSYQYTKINIHQRKHNSYRLYIIIKHIYFNYVNKY